MISKLDDEGSGGPPSFFFFFFFFSLPCSYRSPYAPFIKGSEGSGRGEAVLHRWLEANPDDQRVGG